MLAASGATLAAGAPVVLAACGASDEDEDVSPEREAELLNKVFLQQMVVVAALGLASGNVPKELNDPIKQLESLRDQSTRALQDTISGLGGTPTERTEDPVGAENPAEGVARQLEQSIAASLTVIGELTPETRLPVHTAIVEDAAALAAVRLTLGEDPAPDAFVMGPPAAEAA